MARNSKVTPVKRSYAPIFEKAVSKGTWQKLTDMWSDSDVHSARQSFYKFGQRRGYNSFETKWDSAKGVLSVRIFD